MPRKGVTKKKANIKMNSFDDHHKDKRARRNVETAKRTAKDI